MSPNAEESQLPQVTLENARGLLAARQRIEVELREAKQALEEKSQELTELLALSRATLEATTDAILVTNDAGRVTDYNTNYALLWKIPDEVLATKDHQRYLESVSSSFPDPAAFLERVEWIDREDPPETVDRLELLDGRVIERFSRLQLVGSRRAGRVWSFRDVGERERDHALLAAIVASSNDPIVSKTVQGVITSWNAAAERLFGWTAEEAVGRSIMILIPPERHDEESVILERLRKGERIEHFETVRVTKEGRHINVSLTVSPVRDESGRVIGASKIVRDVSERTILLAREQAARERAEEASRLKDEFLATVSHELRAPLNAILGWAQILRSGTLDDEKVRHAITVVERNARTQAQVIEDLLDVSRIITGKLRLDLQPIMPSRVVASAIESVKPMAEAKGVSLGIELDSDAGPISGDASRLQQIVWNLLSNAIKFTPRGGRVSVKLYRADLNVELEVSDTGLGIEPEFLPHVFDRFRQADATTTRSVGGLGLGLAIVRHLVELHGGSVRAESPGRDLGATFTVRLPVRMRVTAEGSDEETAREGAVRVPRRGDAPNLSGARILVVDDDADTRVVLRETLAAYGAEVREASSAREALGIVQLWRPAVVVSDIGLPGEDGYELIRRIRDWERDAGVWTPAVALTAYARTKDRMRALVAGYQVHVAKPIEPMEFALVVAGLIHPPTPKTSTPEPPAVR
jgi:PAS domain S-box-containing protein